MTARSGWKLRPFLNRRVVEPYTADEMKLASMQADLDGPLVDYAAKGTRIELDGMEKVEDRDTYKLKLTMKSGQAIHVWIDAQTFLEAKIEGQPRRLDGTDHPVEVYFRDYRTVNGLQIPFIAGDQGPPGGADGAGAKGSAGSGGADRHREGGGESQARGSALHEAGNRESRRTPGKGTGRACFRLPSLSACRADTRLDAAR